MPRPPFPLFLPAIGTFLSGCAAEDGVDAVLRAASDPRQMLLAYATATCATCIVLLLRGDSGENALLRGARVVGALSFACAPLCWTATGSAAVGVAMAAAGVNAFACATVIMRETARRGRAIEQKKREENDP